MRGVETTLWDRARSSLADGLHWRADRSLTATIPLRLWLAATLSVCLSLFLTGPTRWVAPAALMVGAVAFDVLGRYLDNRTTGFQSWMVFSDTLGMCAVAWFLPATYPGIVMLGAATTMLGFILTGCRAPRWPIHAVTAMTGLCGLVVAHPDPPTAMTTWAIGAVGSTAFMILAPSRIRPVWDAALRYRETVDSAGVLVWEQLAPGSTRLEVSATSLAILGHTPEQWARSGFWASVVHPDDARHLSGTSVAELAAEGGRRIRVRDSDGEWRTLATRLTATGDDSAGGGGPTALRLRGVSYDVTAEERLRTLERDLAHTDHRTGLPRRRLAVEALDSAVSSGRMVGLVWLSITNTREIADAFDFAMGDRTVRSIGQRLSGFDPCRLVAAANDGQFAAVIDAHRGESAAEFRRRMGTIADEILTTVERPVPLGGTVAACRAAIGIAIGPDHSPRGEELLRLAERAADRARTVTPPIVWVRPALDRPSATTHDLTLDLRAAVEHGQFVTHFQPIVHVDDGSWDAVEALVRWDHPTRGLLTPGSFLPIAEATGQLRSITWIVLDDAIEMARRLQEGGTRVRVAMNLDAQALAYEAAVDAICEAAHAAGLEPGRLQIEVIESELISDPASASAALDRFRAAGITTAIDDFGTGHSSLARLVELSVDEVKLDRKFLQGMQRSWRGAPLVKCLVTTLTSLGVRVIAEGVENAEMAAMVSQAGVDLVQGYHFARAMPADRLLEVGVEQEWVSVASDRD